MKKMEKVELVSLTADESKLVNGGSGEIYVEGSYGPSGGDVKAGIKFTF
jgi:hypothetical protein